MAPRQLCVADHPLFAIATTTWALLRPNPPESAPLAHRVRVTPEDFRDVGSRIPFLNLPLVGEGFQDRKYSLQSVQQLAQSIVGVGF